jgi:long-chain acyl-CoA synthetase
MKGETVKAFVVFRPGMTATDAELKAFSRERLAPYKVPSQFEVVPELPKTQVGKVLRRALKQ